MNYYELLEVDSNASMEVIKNAYKTLAKKFHPDTYAGDRTFAEEKMKLLNEAMSVLEDEERRKNYNLENNIGIRQEFSTVFGSPGAERKHTFMDDIDDFINDGNTGPKNKTAKPVKPGGKKTIIIDDAEDIENIANYHGKRKVESKNKYENDDDDDGDGDETGHDFPVNVRLNELDIDVELDDIGLPKKRREKNKPKVGKWYYITVAVLALINIALVLLIVNSINFENIKNLIAAKNASDNGAYDDGDNDETEPEEEYAGENTGGEYDYMMAAAASPVVAEEAADLNKGESGSDGNDDIPQAAGDDSASIPGHIPSATAPPATEPTSGSVKAVAVPPATVKPSVPTASPNPPPANKAPVPAATKAVAPTPTTPPATAKATVPPDSDKSDKADKAETQPAAGIGTDDIPDFSEVGDIDTDIDIDTDAANPGNEVETEQETNEHSVQDAQETTEPYIDAPPPESSAESDRTENNIEETNAQNVEQNIEATQPETAAPAENIPEPTEPPKPDPEVIADNGGSDNGAPPNDGESVQPEQAAEEGE